MPTEKNRLTVNIDDEMNEDLERLQELKGKKSKSSLLVELAKEALELREDLYFAKIAEARMDEETMSLEEVEAELNKK